MDTRLCVLFAKLSWILLNWNLLGLIQSHLNKELSILKFSSTLKDKLTELRRVIGMGVDKISEWIYSMLKMAEIHCINEERKNRIKTKDILCI